MKDNENIKNSATTAPGEKSPVLKTPAPEDTGDTKPKDNGVKADTTAKPPEQNRPTEASADQPDKAGKKTDQAEEKVESKAKAKTKPGQPKVSSPKNRRPFPFTAALALILGLAVAAASYYNYTRWQLSDLQSQTLGNENTQLRSQLGELQNQISALQRQDLNHNLTEEKLRADQQLQTDSVKQLSQQLKALSADKGKDPVLWRLSEIEYLLSVANQRILLERDVHTATVALQDADKRLDAIGDPALIPIRKLIASELTALKSVDTPDITGMALRLTSLVDNIQKLPLVSREGTKSSQQSSDSQLVDSFSELMANIMRDLKSVVSIRRSDQPIEPLLPPEEQYYLSQNLGLKLEESRIALLRRDTETFHQDLADTRDWIQRYFNKDSAAVGNVLATLDDFQNVELKPDLPDISGSLRELRRWISLQKQQVNS